MAVTYTETDIEFYKAALARYAAKEKFLIDTYTRYLDALQEERESLTEQTPSLARFEWLRVVVARFEVYKRVIEDIKTPCDSFITDYEWSKVK